MVKNKLDPPKLIKGNEIPFAEYYVSLFCNIKNRGLKTDKHGNSPAKMS